MVIDFHNHTYPEKIAAVTVQKLSDVANTIPYSDGTVGGLINSLKNANIDLGVILPVATNPSQVEKINTRANETNLLHKNDGVFSIATMHPDYENYKVELERIKDLGLKGIKIHPDYQGTFFNDNRYKNIIKYAFKLGLFVVVHAGIDIGLPNPVHCSVEAINEVIDECCTDESKLVLAHMGGWMLWEQVLEEIAGKNVYFDTAVSIGDMQFKTTKEYFHLMNDDLFRALVKKHGADKVLFGTDSPWGGHSETLEYFKSFNFSQDENDLILYKNAKRLLNI